MSRQIPKICACICTFKRPRLLQKLLLELCKQETAGEFTFSVSVVDNDREASAKSVVEEVAARFPIRIVYAVEPLQNIAMARNRVVSNAVGDFLAFIDDDEFPENNWLLTAFRACNTHQVDGVLAPVLPYFEHEPPGWLVKGRFCDRPGHPTGYRLNWRETRTGNVMIRRRVLEGVDEPFRREFGCGGEDQDFFKRMMERGHVFIWCNEAAVHEVVPPERCRRLYMLKRALQRGLAERALADARGVAKSLVAVPLYALILPFLLLAGHHWFMRYLIRLCDHLGRLAGLVGWRPFGKAYVSG